jgi:hypothetical protein
MYADYKSIKILNPTALPPPTQSPPQLATTQPFSGKIFVNDITKFQIMVLYAINNNKSHNIQQKMHHKDPPIHTR